MDGVRLLGPALVDQVRRSHGDGVDEILRVRTSWGLGFALPGGPMWPASEEIGGLFGHSGATGSFAFADPERGLAFAYVPGRGSELLQGGDFRVRGLIEALYRSPALNEPGRTPH